MTSAELDRITGTAFRSFMRDWATGVAVVTSTQGAAPVGCTVNAFTSVSLDPPLLLVSLARGSRTLAAITASKVFGVNVLDDRQGELAKRFAVGTGDRFAGTPHRRELGVPVIEDVLAAVVCEVEWCVVGGDHVLVLGRPRWCSRERAGEPLVFFRGGWR